MFNLISNYIPSGMGKSFQPRWNEVQTCVSELLLTKLVPLSIEIFGRGLGTPESIRERFQRAVKASTVDWVVKMPTMAIMTEAQPDRMPVENPPVAPQVTETSAAQPVIETPTVPSLG